MTRVWCFLWMLVGLRLSPLFGSFVGTPEFNSFHNIGVSRPVGLHPRSEIDLSTEKQVLSCAGQNKSLECVSPGSTIAIMDTFWGRLSDKICPSEDGDPNTNCATDLSTTLLLKKLCDDKVFCEIPARHTVLQNPGTSHCPGVNKYLIVNYTCVPVERKLVLCDGETTNLQCGEGWKLNIIEAFWGRTSPVTCATTLGRPSRLGKCDNQNNTLRTVQQLCQGRGGCVMRADATHMIRGTEHCPDVDKYAMIRYRCQPNVVEESATGDLPSTSTRESDGVGTNNFQQNIHPQITHEPSLLQATNPSGAQTSHGKSSLDSLLQEYMESQKSNGDETEDTELSVPHDGPPPPKEALGVPQDGSEEDLQKDIALLKKILHSRKLMKVGEKAFKGIDDATLAKATNNKPSPLHLDLSKEELQHLEHSPDAIKAIEEYVNKTKQGKLSENDKSGSQNGTKGQENVQQKTSDSEPKPTDKPTSVATTEKHQPSKFDIKNLDPTAKLGGKIMGNLLYDKYLKTAEKQTKAAPNAADQTQLKTMSDLRVKISALQAISDALALITAKMEPDEKGGTRQHNINRGHFDVGSLEVSENVEQKDIKFLQEKINKAIETTEEMGREAAMKNPHLVALNLKGKVSQDVTGVTRNNVHQQKERQRVDKEIKDIEDSFNDFIKKAEKSGKFKVTSKPTDSLFQQIQSGVFKLNFDDDKTKKQPDNTTKGVYGFEVEPQEPVINVITEKDSNAQSKTVESPTSRSTQSSPLQRVLQENAAPQKEEQKSEDSLHEHNALENVASQKGDQKSEDSLHELNAQHLVNLPPHTANKAVNSITTALRRQSNKNNKSVSIALKPITTFHSIENDVTLGGRINSEIIKEKEKEKSYHGKDVSSLLNILRVKQTAKTMDVNQTNNKTKPNENKSSPEVKTVGKMDENTMKILSLVVQGYLDQTNKKPHRHRRRKKYHRKIKAEEEDFMVGAKHDEVNSNGSKKELDKNLLDMLEKQLASSQKSNLNLGGNIVSDVVGNQESTDEYDTSIKPVPRVPSDQEEEEEQELPNEFFDKVSKKPTAAPTDDTSIEMVSRYSPGTTLDSLLSTLKGMIQQAKLDDTRNSKQTGVTISDVAATPAQTINAAKTSLPLSKPHVIQFSGAATSGKIASSTNAGKKSDSKDRQVTLFTGGRILDHGTAVLKPVLKPLSQATLAALNIAPTTKSSVGTTQSRKSLSRIKLDRLVSGVKQLLKAMRGNISDSDNSDIEYGKDDDNYNDVSKEYDSDYSDGRVNDVGFTNLNANPNSRSRNNGYHRNKWYPGNRYRLGYQSPKTDYEYDEQFDMNLAQQYTSSPKEYSTFQTDRYSGPYNSYALQPPAAYAGPVPVQGPFPKPYYLPNKARHALNSVLRNDPIMQAVEEFSNNESKLYNDRLRGVQRNVVPHQNVE